MSNNYEAIAARIAVVRARKFLADLEALKLSQTSPEELHHFLGRAAGVIDGLIEAVEPPAKNGASRDLQVAHPSADRERGAPQPGAPPRPEARDHGTVRRPGARLRHPRPERTTAVRARHRRPRRMQEGRPVTVDATPPPPVRCTTCNGSGLGDTVITGNGTHRAPCSPCGGSGQTSG
ncbi:zinc finger-like domain-containing protein [Streptomyces sp. WAC05858]|uniref:zinc finger-like domain-containing protein n=1 Tax=Streptomyces TaxID=1883 RepID=UPI000F793721|nr:zinc finger-like domain-containing protein [Streptomyces sp. WAC05858]RSS47566.1 hypothetical protein EF902_08925 [Streptomyces sp. WAC05858]